MAIQLTRQGYYRLKVKFWLKSKFIKLTGSRTIYSGSLQTLNPNIVTLLYSLIKHLDRFTKLSRDALLHHWRMFPFSSYSLPVSYIRENKILNKKLINKFDILVTFASLREQHEKGWIIYMYGTNMTNKKGNYVTCKTLHENNKCSYHPYQSRV